MKCAHHLLGTAWLLGFFALTSAVHGGSFTFDKIGDGSGDDVGGSLSVSFPDEVNNGKADFNLANSSASSVTRIYFEDKNGSLLGSFESLTPNPSKNGPSFEFDSNASFQQGPSSFNADGGLVTTGAGGSGGGQPQDGIEQGESLDFQFSAPNNPDFGKQVRNGDLVFGLQVQSIGDNEGSAQFMSANMSAVPEPSEYAMMAAGILALVGYGWNRYGRNRVATQAEE